MEKQNVTLSIPKDILKKARILAVERETSLSGLLTQALTEIVERRQEYEAARTAQLGVLEEGFDLGTRGNIGWQRDTLHER